MYPPGRGPDINIEVAQVLACRDEYTRALDIDLDWLTLAHDKHVCEITTSLLIMEPASARKCCSPWTPVVALVHSQPLPQD